MAEVQQLTETLEYAGAKIIFDNMVRMGFVGKGEETMRVADK